MAMLLTHTAVSILEQLAQFSPVRRTESFERRLEFELVRTRQCLQKVDDLVAMSRVDASQPPTPRPTLT